MLKNDACYLSTCSYQAVKVIVDESLMLLRSLLFLFSFTIVIAPSSPHLQISPSEMDALLDFCSTAASQYQFVYRTHKEELFRVDAIASLQAHSDIVIIASLLRQPVVAALSASSSPSSSANPSSAASSERVWDASTLLGYVNKLKELKEGVYGVVACFALSVSALTRKDVKRDDSREFRGMLRHVRACSVTHSIVHEARRLLETLPRRGVAGDAQQRSGL